MSYLPKYQLHEYLAECGWEPDSAGVWQSSDDGQIFKAMPLTVSWSKGEYRGLTSAAALHVQRREQNVKGYELSNRILIYDIETKRGPLSKKQTPEQGIEYAKGWEDYEGMGVSVIGAWDIASNLPRVFCADNLDAFQSLVDQYDLLVTFNGINFDNQVLKAAGLRIPDGKNFDLLHAIWQAHGITPADPARGLRFVPHVHGGYSLDACCSVNFGASKSGDGAMAPVWYQRGQWGKLIDYCLCDVMLTRRLFLKAASGPLTSPKTNEPIELKMPEMVKVKK